MDIRVASRYAQAFYDVAAEQNLVEAVYTDLTSIGHVLESDPRLSDFLADPALDSKDKLSLLEKVFGDRATALTMQLLRLVLSKHRESLIPAITAHFADLRRVSQNILFVEITSAKELSDGDRNGLISRLETQTGKTVEASYSVDPNLIGGVRVGVGNFVLDGSIKGSLSRLKDRLLYDVLKQH